jgi:hypothetical protein
MVDYLNIARSKLEETDSLLMELISVGVEKMRKRC